MDTFWVIILATLAANAYFAVVHVMGKYVLDDMPDRWAGVMSLAWPVSYPLFVLAAAVALAMSKE